MQRGGTAEVMPMEASWKDRHVEGSEGFRSRSRKMFSCCHRHDCGVRVLQKESAVPAVVAQCGFEWQEGICLRILHAAIMRMEHYGESMSFCQMAKFTRAEAFLGILQIPRLRKSCQAVLAVNGLARLQYIVYVFSFQRHQLYTKKCIETDY